MRLILNLISESRNLVSYYWPKHILEFIYWNSSRGLLLNRQTKKAAPYFYETTRSHFCCGQLARNP